MSRDITIFPGPEYGEKALKLFQAKSNLRTVAWGYLKNIELSITYTNCMDIKIFADSQKESDIVPVNKKGDNQLLENYRLISLLPILAKVFEKFYKIIYFNICKKTTFFAKISLVFDHLILVNISFPQQLMKFMHHLITVLHLMLGLFFRYFKSL